MCFCPADSSGPSSTVSSAGPSSPTADTSPRFSFSDKTPLTPQSSEETHSSQNAPPAQPPPPALNPPATDHLAELPLTEDGRGELGPVDGAQEGPEAAASDAGSRPPCGALAELSLARMEGYSLPGSLPVLLELRESSSEAGSSSQTPQSPDGPDEFFDTQESMELWMDGPEGLPRPETPPEATGGAEP